MSDKNSPFCPSKKVKSITISITAITGIFIGIYIAAIITWDSKDLLLGLIIVWCTLFFLSNFGLYYWGKFKKSKTLSDLHIWVSMPLIAPIFITGFASDPLTGLKSIPFAITISLIILENYCFKAFDNSNTVPHSEVISASKKATKKVSPYITFTSLFFIALFLIAAIIPLSMKAPSTSTRYQSSPSYSQYRYSNYKEYDPPPTFNVDQYTPPPTIDWDSFYVPTNPVQACETTTPPTTAPSTAPIVFVLYPDTASRNEKVTVKIKGEPHTLYSITVTYSSGPSTATGLQPKESDASGYVAWTWKVGGRTDFGTYPITVEGGGDSKTVRFKVTT